MHTKNVREELRSQQDKAAGMLRTNQSAHYLLATTPALCRLD